MSCPVDTDMVVVSSGFGSMMIGRAPPPFSCGPKASESDYAGYWDTRCPNKQCRVDTAYSNATYHFDARRCTVSYIGANFMLCHLQRKD